MSILFIFIQPFSKDRSFYILIDGVFKEVKFCVSLVNGLTALNAPGNRENIAYDKRFIKGLIIGICSTKEIMKGTPINKDLLKFFKG